jgi:hypothetical protein
MVDPVNEVVSTMQPESSGAVEPGVQAVFFHGRRVTIEPLLAPVE